MCGAGPFHLCYFVSNPSEGSPHVGATLAAGCEIYDKRGRGPDETGAALSVSENTTKRRKEHETEEETAAFVLSKRTFVSFVFYFCGGWQQPGIRTHRFLRIVFPPGDIDRMHMHHNRIIVVRSGGALPKKTADTAKEKPEQLKHQRTRDGGGRLRRHKGCVQIPAGRNVCVCVCLAFSVARGSMALVGLRTIRPLLEQCSGCPR